MEFSSIVLYFNLERYWYRLMMIYDNDEYISVFVCTFLYLDIISSTEILAADWSIAVGYWIVFHCLSINGNVRIRINVSYPHSQIEAPTLIVLSHSQIEALTFNVLSHFAMVTMGLTGLLHMFFGYSTKVTQQWERHTCTCFKQ